MGLVIIYTRIVSELYDEIRSNFLSQIFLTDSVIEKILTFFSFDNRGLQLLFVGKYFFVLKSVNMIFLQTSMCLVLV